MSLIRTIVCRYCMSLRLAFALEMDGCWLARSACDAPPAVP
jgi:hypothetical protein